jgi:hypothetical protein
VEVEKMFINKDQKFMQIIRWVFVSIFVVLIIGVLVIGFFRFWYSISEINTPDIGDGGLITNDPCGPPCFWNITPGKTTIDEVFRVIEGKEITEECETVKDEDKDNDYFICGNSFMIVYSEKNKTISNISLYLTQEINMKVIINELGPPDRVFSKVGELPDYPDSLDMWIFYDEILTKLRLETQPIVDGNWYYQLSESTIVDTIEYYDEEGYENNTLYRFASIWQGFGEYLGEWFPSP